MEPMSIRLDANAMWALEDLASAIDVARRRTSTRQGDELKVVQNYRLAPDPSGLLLTDGDDAEKGKERRRTAPKRGMVRVK